VRHGYRRALLLLPVLALAATTALHAETQYVVEQVVVNVLSAPDASGTRVGSIKSGDGVEVLDRQGEVLHVKMANGTDGWVRKSYLSPQLPLKTQVADRTAEVEKLKQDVTRLEGELASARAGPREKTAGAAVGPSPSADPNADPAAAHDPAPSYFMTPPDAPARPVWHWAAGSFVVALLLGFVLGWYMLDRRIRAKYGGLRIY
jgi:Bacterial SH3 domain